MNRSGDMETRCTDDRKLADFLLLNAYSMDVCGLLNGKAGIALTLFELSRVWDDHALEEHAFSILQPALVSQTDCSFASGKAGIGYALDYLIQYQFLEADYEELYREQHHEVVTAVLKPEFDNRDILECGRLWYFMKKKKLAGLENEQQAATQKLQKLIEDFVRQFTVKGRVSIPLFFSVSALVLYGLCCLKVTEEERGLAADLIRQVLLLQNEGYVYDYPWLGYVLKEYGRKWGNKELEQCGKEALVVAVRNTLPGISVLQQLLDTWSCIHGEKEPLLSEKSARLRDFFSTPDEQLLQNGIPYLSGCIGLEWGIARLLLVKAGLKEERRMRILELLNLTI